MTKVRVDRRTLPRFHDVYDPRDGSGPIIVRAVEAHGVTIRTRQNESKTIPWPKWPAWLARHVKRVAKS